MSLVIQSTLYLMTAGTVVSKNRKTIKVSIDESSSIIPIHSLNSVCVFGNIRLTPNVISLCLENQVSVHFHTQNGYLLGQVVGSGDTRYLVRQSQYAKAENPQAACEIARLFVAGKIQNSRINLLRARREAQLKTDCTELTKAIKSHERVLLQLMNEERDGMLASTVREALDPIRGLEGIAAKSYFEAFTYMLKQQREEFKFTKRSRRPPQDRINCLLSFLYALLRSDCLTALSVAGIDPYVGWLHTTRAGRPACALDLMEEFRPYAERLAITLINRQQIRCEHFRDLDGGAVEFTESGRKIVVNAWQKRKKAEFKHELFEQKVLMGHVFSIQARLLSRWLRGEIPHYVPFIKS